MESTSFESRATAAGAMTTWDLREKGATHLARVLELALDGEKALAVVEKLLTEASLDGFRAGYQESAKVFE